MSDSSLRHSPPLVARYLLVTSLLLVLLPHLFRLPLWLAATSLAVLGWRLLRDYFDWPLPSKLLRSVLILLGIGSILLAFRSILGREAGSALLSVLICLKLLELRTLRDGILLVFLGYFLVLTNFLFEESILTGLYMFVNVVALSASLIALNHPHATLTRTPSYLKQALMLLIQAVPFMVLLFILFPRLNTPLWRIPEPNSLSRTGLSDEMHPGDITHLADSDELVFRAEFMGTIPQADHLYWRGPVLWNTDGRSWLKLTPKQLDRISSHALHFEALSEPIRYRVIVEPQKGLWLFALDLPAKAADDLEQGSQLLPDFQLVPNRKLAERTRYTIASVTSYHTGDLEPAEREYALQLPLDVNPRTRQLAAHWRAITAQDADLVKRALDYFRAEPFIYTHTPAALGQDPIDQFLFSTRQGFCEHYAAAFVTLMRSAGIPSRVVTGYQGGDFNAIGNFLEIRQNRAHAWAEVWLARYGWVRIDPTAVIPPDRIMESQDVTRFRSTAPYSISADLPLLRNGWLLKFQQGWNAMNYSWSVWVLGFNEERQQALLKQWGIDNLGMRTLISILMIGLGLFFVTIAFIIFDRKPINDPVLRHYQRFCRRLAKAGVECPAHEGPFRLGERATTMLPHHAERIQAIIAAYVALRYGRGDVQQLFEFKRLVDRFRP